MTNEERAALGRRVLAFFNERAVIEDAANPDPDSLVDCLADLMHYCNESHRRGSFDVALAIARDHFDAEVAGR